MKTQQEYLLHTPEFSIYRLPQKAVLVLTTVTAKSHLAGSQLMKG